MLRRLFRVAWYALAAIVVTMAVVSSVARLLVPEVEAYRDYVQQWARDASGKAVAIGQLEAAIHGVTPTLILKDVAISEPESQETLLRLNEARIAIDVVASLRSRQIVPSRVTMLGAQLIVTRLPNGAIVVQGVSAMSQPQTIEQPTPALIETTRLFFTRGTVVIEESEITWQDLKGEGLPWTFSNVSLRLRNHGDRHLVDMNITLPTYLGRYFSMAVDFSGDLTEPGSVIGQFYANASGIRLDELGFKPVLRGLRLEDGGASFQVWGDFRDGGVYTVHGDGRLDDLVFTKVASAERVLVNKLGGSFAWRGESNGWRLAVDNFQLALRGEPWPLTQISVVRAADDSGSAWRIASSYGRIQDLTRLLGDLGAADEDARARLARVRPRGELHSLNLTWRQPTGSAPHLDLSVMFRDVAFDASDKLPGASALQGRLRVNGDQGTVELNTVAAYLDMPKLFRNPIELGRIRGTAHWHRQENAWRVAARGLHVGNRRVQTESDLLLVVPHAAESPYMDLQVSFSDGDATSVSHYLPVHIISSKLRDWLDQAFTSGTVTRGGLLFNGRLNQFPFRRNEGVFKVQFDVEDATLDYRSDWPPLTGVDAEAMFTGTGVSVTASAARLRGNDLTNIEIAIDDYRAPRLAARGVARGGTAQLVDFLTHSPLAASLSSRLSEFAYGGQATTTLTLDIPLSEREAKRAALRVNGRAELTDASLQMWDGYVAFTNVNGVVEFTESDRRAKGITAQAFGGEAVIDLFTREERAGRSTKIVAKGTLNSDRIDSPQLNPLKRYANGRARWQAVVDLPPLGQEESRTQVRVASDLAGLALELPEPLRKPADQARELSVDVVLRADKPTRLMVNHEGELGIALELDSRDGSLVVGPGEVVLGPGSARMPDERILSVRGAAVQVPVAEWSAFWRGIGNESPGESARVLWTVPIAIDMTALHLIGFDGPDQGQGGVPDPRTVPQVLGRIGQLYLNAAHLGEVQFETARVVDGIELKRLRASLPSGELTANGAWTERDGLNLTKVDATINSEDFGQLLRELALSAVLKGGKGDLGISLAWDSAPHDPSYEAINGAIDLSLRDGRLEELDPGAGRLVGLLSLAALPRRLRLDFSDVFGQGLEFDNIAGTMSIERGSVRTDDLKMEGPAAQILVTGRSKLVTKEYDYVVSVRPRVSGALPVAGGLVWGPQVGAVILLVQQVLQSEIDKAGQTRYRVTGTWDAPRIRRIDPPRSARQDDAPATAEE